jgi:hypothetical protein
MNIKMKISSIVQITVASLIWFNSNAVAQKSTYEILGEKIATASDLAMQSIDPRDSKNAARSSKNFADILVKHTPEKGPIQLVIDFAAQDVGDSSIGEAAFSIGVECPGARTGCPIPAQLSVMSFRTNFMGKQKIELDGKQVPVQYGRESNTYRFSQDTVKSGETVRFTVALLEPKGLKPELAHVRILYGDYSDKTLKGQTSKRAVFWIIVLLGVAGLVGLFWWRARDMSNSSV